VTYRRRPIFYAAETSGGMAKPILGASYYIHYNPVKHCLVMNPGDWSASTFHSYVKTGLYPVNWGGGVSFNTDDKFGE